MLSKDTKQRLSSLNYSVCIIRLPATRPSEPHVCSCTPHRQRGRKLSSVCPSPFPERKSAFCWPASISSCPTGLALLITLPGLAAATSGDWRGPTHGQPPCCSSATPPPSLSPHAHQVPPGHPTLHVCTCTCTANIHPPTRRLSYLPTCLPIALFHQKRAKDAPDHRIFPLLLQVSSPVLGESSNLR